MGRVRKSCNVTLLPARERVPAAGAFTSRGGPGEGVGEYVAEFMKRRFAP
jgi:hypothetical protein